jgi:hypothetical protein
MRAVPINNGTYSVSPGTKNCSIAGSTMGAVRPPSLALDIGASFGAMPPSAAAFG